MKRSNSPPMYAAFLRAYNAYKKAYKQNMPFVLLFQIGKFLETYDESAEVLGTHLSMNVRQKDGNVSTAGFPIGSIDKHIVSLCKKGFAVIQKIQTEDSETKRQRSNSGNRVSNQVERTVLPHTTLNFICDKPLCIIQGDAVLMFFSETNYYSIFHVPTNDDILCRLMEYEPCEIICSSSLGCIQSMRHILPDAIVRQYFEMGFSIEETLRKYLSILSRNNVQPTEKVMRMREKCHLDARTVINLTLFGSEYSLVNMLSSSMSKEAKSSLVHMLHNPTADMETIQEQQKRIHTMMKCVYLDSMFVNKPKKNTLATYRHPLHKDITKFVFTETNVRNYLQLIEKTYLEIELWFKWEEMIRKYIPDLDFGPPNNFTLQKPTFNGFTSIDRSNEEIQQILVQFTHNYMVDVKIVDSGMFKHFFETNVANEKQVREIPNVNVVSKTKQVIRFDTPDLQRARLDDAEEAVKLFTTIAQEITVWMASFQELIKPSIFEEYASIERDICLAYYFQHLDTSISFPMFDQTLPQGHAEMIDLYLPTEMTNKAEREWVSNSSYGRYILYGSNGSGKTSHMRSIAINTLLAHCGLPVFSPCFRMKCTVDSIRMRFGSTDCLAEGKSSFVVELEHMKMIADTMTKRSAIFIDELGCSCDCVSGAQICRYFLKKLNQTHCFFVFATHYDLSSVVIDTELPSFMEMSMDNGKYTFYCQEHGNNKSNKNAVEVAERCEFPAAVLYMAESILISN